MRTRLRNIIVACAILAATLALSTALLSNETKPFTKRDKAFFLDEAAVNFVRPGLIVKIVNASIASDGTITTEVKITDPKGLPLDRTGVTTPGAVAISFVPAVLPNGQNQYVDYAVRTETDAASGRSVTQANSENNGNWQQVGDGDYIYTFRTKATNFDATATHTIGLWASRDLTEFDAGTQYWNDIYTWVPSGAAVTHVHEEIATQTCNQCHDPLMAHGGPRQDMRLCVLCHTPQTTDAQSGNTVDMKVMIHKIHRGADLPSVQAGTPYQIIGFNGSVNDYSEVVFPAESSANCQFCHAPQNQTNPPPPDANAWLSRPSRAACGSCHDNVNFATGENHANLPQVSDNLCTNCHFPQGELEFDISIVGAHTLPRFSTQLPGVVFGITSITNAGAGQNPKVTFTVKDKSGAVIQPSGMNSLSLILAYPTTDYTTAITESARNATANGDGSFSYTFTAAIPAGTAGTGTIGLEGYRNQNITERSDQVAVRDVGQNVDVDFSIDGSPVKPRRAVVTTANCNQCHFRLAAHGTIRNEVKHCALCHNPNATDTPFRPANQMPAQGIEFAMMSHRIHTGDEQESDYTIYGFGGNAFDFKNVLFPGDRRHCEKCHLTNTQELPIPAQLPVVNPRGFINPEGPTQAACLGCHTDQASAAHASLNASPTLGEACSVCHGVNADFSVDRVHAR